MPEACSVAQPCAVRASPDTRLRMKVMPPCAQHQLVRAGQMNFFPLINLGQTTLGSRGISEREYQDSLDRVANAEQIVGSGKESPLPTNITSLLVCLMPFRYSPIQA